MANKKAPEKVESPVEKKTEEAKAPEKVESPVEKKEFPKGDYIMKTSHLSWGRNGMSHFYADKKPLINAKVMRGYESTLEDWIKAGWVIKGSYK